jgi:hypothetical protein
MKDLDSSHTLGCAGSGIPKDKSKLIGHQRSGSKQKEEKKFFFSGFSEGKKTPFFLRFRYVLRK